MNKIIRPTIRDIAEASGYSLGTVSQALNHKPGVAPETRNRVFEIAQSLGYQVKPRNLAPAPQELTTIGLLIKQDAELPYPANPFYSYVIAGAERECQRLGLNLMFASVDVDSHNRVIQWPPLLFDERVDGLLIIGTFLEDSIAQIGDHTDAIVLVDAYAPGLNVDSIVTDNLNGALNAVNYLIDSGHTAIGLLGSTPDAYPSIRERRKGYQRALKQAGIEKTYIEDGLLTREDGYATALKLLRRAPEITAIFACNDEVAIGVMNAAQELNLKIPDNLSLVGFDNIDLVQEVSPRLTTVQVHKTLMGKLGVRHLRDQIERNEPVSVTTIVGTELVVRESVCKITRQTR
ncbi:MAG: LacI family DNA-binding transcriptional regulator [Anaerolineae bacterium]|nr:LacI family DNA-binding transcriptional regulator [Anaerolineae bacterium]